MRAISSVLPFPRGSTWSDGSGQTLDSTTANDLTGRLFVAPDTTHGTGMSVILRCVRTNTAITVGGSVAAPQHRIYSFDGDSKDWGTEIDAVTGSLGEVGKPLDDAYAGELVIAQYDLLYVVEEGPTKVASSTNTAANGAHEAVTPEVGGGLHLEVASGGEYVLGTTDAAISSDDVDSLIYVNGGIGVPDDNS